MKKLNGLQKLAANLFRLPTVVNPIQNQTLQTLGFNNGVTLYPYGKDETFINKGYNKNAWVYSIVSKNAKKFGQVPWYHYKIKTTERKTWAEYVQLTKESLPDVKARIEARKMRTKAIDSAKVQSPLQDLLDRPNENQPRAQFMENLYGYKLLTGEGNVWIPRLEDNSKPTQMVILPKSFIGLVKGISPWNIKEFELLFTQHIKQPKENVIMWRFANYNFDPVSLTHLRGQAPLDAGLLLMQSSNEGSERLIAMNKNQGVAGAVFDKQKRDYPTPAQASFIRGQFNEIINDKDLAGQIAWLTGDLGYIQFGLDAGQLKLLEQADITKEGLCHIFDTPYTLFNSNETYENRKQAKKEWIYDNIAPAAYGLRDDLNARLIPAFNLDRDRDVIDCGVTDLPELVQDQKEAADFIEKMGARLTLNEGREYLGWDRSPDTNLDKHYIASGLQSLDDANMSVGGDLSNEMSQLNGG